MAKALMVFFFIALLSFGASAQSIWLEAETYTASHDEGGLAIYITSCSGASQGLAVEGFDYPGDWIELKLDILQSGAFADSLRSGGLTLEESDLRCTVFGAGLEGDDLVSSFHTVGEGIGWSYANYTKVAGRDSMIVLEGSWTVRLELIAGGRTRLDYISFDTMPNSSVHGGSTWGSIKALYR